MKVNRKHPINLCRKQDTGSYHTTPHNITPLLLSFVFIVNIETAYYGSLKLN